MISVHSMKIIGTCSNTTVRVRSKKEEIGKTLGKICSLIREGLKKTMFGTRESHGDTVGYMD